MGLFGFIVFLLKALYIRMKFMQFLFLLHSEEDIERRNECETDF